MRFIINKLVFIILIILSGACAGQNNKSSQEYELSIKTDTVYHSANTLFLQARSASYPLGGKQHHLITKSIYHNTGSHSYGDLYEMHKKTTSPWSAPKAIVNLTRSEVEGDILRAFGDVTPQWHEHTKVVLATGKSFYSYSPNSKESTNENRVDIEHMQEVAYATYNPIDEKWSSIHTLKLPEKLDNGDDFYCVNAGCTQRYDLPNGDILLPVRYLKNGNYVSTVVLCSFDGTQLTYKKHGSLMTTEAPRGLYEPSITHHKGEYFMTLRGDESAYVAKSKDGLNYEPLKEWTFSDGEALGSCNTQQHWISNEQGLYLVYTRKGANNDEVFRHRAPLFMAQIDPVNISVVKETEQVLIPIPKGNGDVGNFGIDYISNNEVWVMASVMPRRGNETYTLLSKITWREK